MVHRGSDANASTSNYVPALCLHRSRRWRKPVSLEVMTSVLKSVFTLQAGSTAQPCSLTHFPNYCFNSFFSPQTFFTFPHFPLITSSPISLRKLNKSNRMGFPYLVSVRSDALQGYIQVLSALLIVTNHECSPETFQGHCSEWPLDPIPSQFLKDFVPEINHLVLCIIHISLFTQFFSSAHTRSSTYVFSLDLSLLPLHCSFIGELEIVACNHWLHFFTSSLIFHPF